MGLYTVPIRCTLLVYSTYCSDCSDLCTFSFTLLNVECS